MANLSPNLFAYISVLSFLLRVHWCTSSIMLTSLCSRSDSVSDAMEFSIWEIRCAREGSSTSPFNLCRPSFSSALSLASASESQSIEMISPIISRRASDLMSKRVNLLIMSAQVCRASLYWTLLVLFVTIWCG